MDTLFCACCGRPFQRASQRGPAPTYCSRDCRRQMDVRRRIWATAAPAGIAWEQARDRHPPGRIASVR
ncbi:hypothetical protein [Azospirillum sp. ST 5-10]|uniref:hypothetical protein n=1 Tax=unclassified Azospirillum TaxID=2630922 RepID=UPI003F4A39E9